jgi:hypothetical protein
MLFLNEAISWESVSGTFLSIANPLLLSVLVLCCVIEEKAREGIATSEMRTTAG